MTTAGKKRKAPPHPKTKPGAKKRASLSPYNPYKPGKPKRETRLILSELATVLQSGGDDAQYNALLDETDGLAPSDLTQAVIEEVVAQPNHAPIYMSCLIPDLQPMPALPGRIIDRVRRCSPRSPGIFALLFLYSSLYLAGYSMPKPWEQVMEELSVDPVAYDRYSTRLRKNFQTFFGKDEESFDENYAITLIERIQKITPLTQRTPVSRTEGVFSVRMDGKCPLEKYLAGIEGVIKDPYKHEHTFMAPCEARDLPNAVGTIQAKQLAVKIASLCAEGSFAAAGTIINQLKKHEPANALISFIEAKCIQETIHEKKTNVEDYNSKVLQQFVALDTAIDIAGPFPNFYYFEDLAILLEIMGYFHAATILSLSLLRIVPDNVNLLLTVAYTNYQTFGPFQNYLLAAAMFDPVRTINFLDQFWVYDRFRAVDRLQDYHMTRKELEQLEFDVDEEIDERSRELDPEERAP